MFPCCQNSSILNRDDLLNKVKEVLAKEDKEQEFYILNKNDNDKMLHLLADSFMKDPILTWVSGLDKMNHDESLKNELQYSLNKSAMAWTNRPILIGKKGVVIGIKDENDELAGIVSLMPGKLCGKGLIWDLIVGAINIGTPPIYDSLKKHYYQPNATNRLEGLQILDKYKNQNMKDTNKNYVYIQTVGVLSKHQGKGYGGKLLRMILKIIDSLNVPAYLETESKNNEGFYQHFGFSTAQIVEVLPKNGLKNDQALPMYLMRY